MARVELNEAHVARSHVSTIRPITHGAVLDWAKAETRLIIRTLKEQIGVISMTGIRLDGVEILTRIHVLVEDMCMYIYLSEGWTRLRPSLSVSSRRKSLSIPLHWFH